MWTYETLGTIGNARYLGLWQSIENMEQTGPRSVRFTFGGDDREQALVIGLWPVLKKAQWADEDFTRSGLDVVPIGSSPYVIDSFDAGRNVVLKRNPDYWGNDLPIRQGIANFDEIRIEFFGDQAALFEAFKAGEISFVREFNAEKWDRDYDFPAIRSGDIVKAEIPSERPSGITGFVMNTRRAPFDDIRVRDAMIHAFNFEYINETITGGKQPRITSYFSHSQLGMREGLPKVACASFWRPSPTVSPPAGSTATPCPPVTARPATAPTSVPPPVFWTRPAGSPAMTGCAAMPPAIPCGSRSCCARATSRTRRSSTST